MKSCLFSLLCLVFLNVGCAKSPHGPSESSESSMPPPLASELPSTTADPQSHLSSAQIEHLKVVNPFGEPDSPELIVFLLAYYMDSNQLESGIEYFSAVLEQHGNRMSPEHRSVYLAALGAVRAKRTRQLPLVQRLSWVGESIDMLKRAKQESLHANFLVRWMVGVVYANMPAFLNKTEAALEDLNWCVANSAKAPHPDWLNEVYFQLGRLQDRAGNTAQAQTFLNRSGSTSFEKEHMLTPPFPTATTL